MRLFLCVVLVGIGCLQILGWVFRLDTIRSLGMLTVASPLPLVFSEVKGVETFALDFYLVYESSTGASHQVLVTPELYSRFDRPYNYRNVVGAALSYGPILPEELRNSVLYYCMIEPGVLRDMLGLPSDIQSPKIMVKTRTKGRDQTWVFDPEGSL